MRVSINNNPPIRNNDARIASEKLTTYHRLSTTYYFLKSSKFSAMTARSTEKQKPDSQYAIQGGQSGRRRLDILHQALAPTTRDFWYRTGIGPEQCGLDLGCGGGALSLELAPRLGPKGALTGIDRDEENIIYAGATAKSQGLSQLRFIKADLDYWVGETNRYDFVYARFLLSHLANPGLMVKKIFQWLKPGGRILLEDIDFTGHFCYPQCDAFSTYVSWYTAVVRRLGADPNIGPQLPALVEAARFSRIQLQVVQPVFQTGPGKQMGSLTLENIAGSLIEQGLAGWEEIRNCTAELRAFEQQKNTLASLPRIFQVWAVKPE